MVTAPEASVLLTMCCARDHRKPDRFTTAAWAEDLADIDFQDAQTAILAHYRQSKEWLMPADIIREVRRVEAVRIAEGPNLDDLEPPAWLSNMEDGPEFVAAYSTWYKEQKWRIRRGLEPEVGAPVIPVARRSDQLVS